MNVTFRQSNSHSVSYRRFSSLVQSEIILIIVSAWCQARYVHYILTVPCTIIIQPHLSYTVFMMMICLEEYQHRTQWVLFACIKKGQELHFQSECKTSKHLIYNCVKQDMKCNVNNTMPNSIFLIIYTENMLSFWNWNCIRSIKSQD